jgi:hypothetical protein
MEIGWFICDPPKKLGDIRIARNRPVVFPEASQFGIAESFVDRLVTDRMHRNRFSTLFRLGYEMVPLDAVTEVTPAQPAGELRFAQPFFSAAFFFFIAS